MPSRSYTQQTIKLLFGRAAARCSICRGEVTVPASGLDPAVVVGAQAHIYAFGDRGPRARPDLDDRQRNDYENLILLCGHCHPTVDGQPNTYTYEFLLDQKAQHEEWVSRRLEESAPEVGFAELECVATAISASSPSIPSGDYRAPDVSEKIRRNGLGAPTARSLSLGMAQFHEVERYVTHLAQVDTTYPERLRAGFVDRYNQLVEGGVSGDGLFEALRLFACRGAPGDFVRNAASVAVLAYFFQKCDVFEAP